MVPYFETDSDGPLTIQGIDTVYRFRGGVAEIVFMRDDIIILSSSVADRSSAIRSRRRCCTGSSSDRS